MEEVALSELRAGFHQTQNEKGTLPCGGSSELQSWDSGGTQPLWETREGLLTRWMTCGSAEMIRG